MLRVTENRDPLLARPFGISSVLSRSSIEIVYRVVGRGTTLLTGVGNRTDAEPARPARERASPCRQRGACPFWSAAGAGFLRFIFLPSAPEHRAHFFIGARNKECLPPAGILKSFQGGSGAGACRDRGRQRRRAGNVHGYPERVPFEDGEEIPSRHLCLRPPCHAGCGQQDRGGTCHSLLCIHGGAHGLRPGRLHGLLRFRRRPADTSGHARKGRCSMRGISMERTGISFRSTGVANMNQSAECGVRNAE